MKQILKIILPLAILIILGLAFYWFQWRPTEIRQRCFAEATISSGGGIGWNNAVEQENINNYYSNCLKMWGLEK